MKTAFPHTETMNQPIKLTLTETLAVRTLAQSEANLKRMAEAHEAEARGVAAELEKAYGLDAETILKGEWEIVPDRGELIPVPQMAATE